MANVYVRSGAAGAGTGADWANAFTTLAAALSAKAAGDDFWVAEDHAETQASAMTLTAPGTVASPNRIICVNHAGSVPPVSADLATTATVTTTGASAITITGFIYCYGIIFSIGSGANAASVFLSNTAGNYQRYDACAVRLGATTSGQIVTGPGTATVEFNNTTIQVATATSTINARCRFIWRNTSSAITGATFPTTLFAAGNGIISLEAVDLSALSAKTLVPNNTANGATYYFKDCKLPTSITIGAAQTGGIGTNDIFVTRCDSASANTNYRNERHNYAGDQTTETTIIRTGGASDGTQGVSFKVVTSANTTWHTPFTCIPISIWNDVAGSSVTATICGIWGGGAVPNKQDCWVDIEYPGDSASPQGSFVTSGNADALATAAGAIDSSTWGGSTTPFKLAVTFTPQKKGPLTLYVRCAKPASTFYIDPKVTLT